MRPRPGSRSARKRFCLRVVQTDFLLAFDMSLYGGPSGKRCRAKECRVCRENIHAGILCEAELPSGSLSHLEILVWTHNHAPLALSPPTSFCSVAVWPHSMRAVRLPARLSERLSHGI